MGKSRVLGVLLGVVVVALVAAAFVRSTGDPSEGSRPASSPPGDVPEVLVDLAETTAAQGSVSFRLTMRSTYPGEFEISPKTLNGTGYFAFDPPRARIRTATFVKEPVRGGPVTEIVRIVRLGDDLYVFPTEAAASETSNRVRDYWLVQSAEGVEKGVQGFPSAELGQSLDLVLALPGGYVSTPEASADEIDGVDLTKYSGEVDLERAGFSPGEYEGVAYLEESVIPVDVWVDAEGVARRVAFSIGMDTPLVDGGAGVTRRDYVFDLFDFGANERVEAPPRDDVITAEEHAELLDEYAHPIAPAPDPTNG